MQWDICVWCGRHICSEAYVNNVKYMYTNVPGHVADISDGVHIRYMYRHVAFEGHISSWHVVACFLSHDADGAINDTIAFVMLRWLFRGIIWLMAPVLVPVLASVLGAICITWCWCQWYHITKVMLHLIYLRNSMVPLMTPSASHEVNGIIWWKVMLHLISIIFN